MTEKRGSVGPSVTLAASNGIGLSRYSAPSSLEARLLTVFRKL